MATVWGKATEMPFLETPFLDFLQALVAAFGKVGIGAGASGNRACQSKETIKILVGLGVWVPLGTQGGMWMISGVPCKDEIVVC